MPRAPEDPNAPKPNKPNWTDSKVWFVLNDFLNQKEDGNMVGKNWKHVAYTNVPEKYNQAYPKEPLNIGQIKNMYTSKKGLHALMQRLKVLSGLGWVEGEHRIDMAVEWWESDEKSLTDRDQLECLCSREKDEVNKNQSVDGKGSVRAEREVDDSDNHQHSEREVVGEESIMASDHSLSPIMDKTINQSPSDSGQDSIPRTDSGFANPQDSPQVVCSTSDKMLVVSFKKKTPACKFKPATLSQAITLASHDSIKKSNNLLKLDELKAKQATNRDWSIEDAACIKAEKLPHQQNALAVFNERSENELPKVQDLLMAINAIKPESKVSIFVWLDEKMRWVWLHSQVSDQKKKGI
ncbi:hypothetical protein DFH28DRAFT_1130252 [Melampsora americana]|nr:hypothetical protein DFH28DRAFT_1130252 [Melampsora americana]